MSETYIRMRGSVLEVRPREVLFSVGDSVPSAAWIPRSLIHGADERDLDGAHPGEERTLRIFDWKVDELGWDDATIEGGAGADLFEERG